MVFTLKHSTLYHLRIVTYMYTGSSDLGIKTRFEVRFSEFANIKRAPIIVILTVKIGINSDDHGADQRVSCFLLSPGIVVFLSLSLMIISVMFPANFKGLCSPPRVRSMRGRLALQDFSAVKLRISY